MIQISQLTKRFGSLTAVDDMTFNIKPGRVTGFVGPNGSGKSTTMRMMVGLTQPNSGSVKYAGTDYRDLDTPARMVGCLLDPQVAHPGRSARNHLKMMAALSKVPAARVDECLATVGLADAAKRRAGGFSLGMRQRLALASALIGNPEVLLLDEPFNGLDPDGVRWLRDFVRAFANRGGTAFVSSHIISELSLYADDIVVIGEGKLLAAATTEELVQHYELKVQVDTPAVEALMHVLGSRPTSAERTPNGVVIGGMSREDIADAAMHGQVPIHGLTEVTKNLEDALIDLTQSSVTYRGA